MRGLAPWTFYRIEAGLQAGDPRFEGILAWRWYQQLRSAFTATSLAEGGAIAKQVLGLFPTYKRRSLRAAPRGG